MFERHSLRLYLVAGTQDCQHLPQTSPEARLLAVLTSALQAGITCYQFREKGAGALQDTVRRTQLAVRCRDLCRYHGVPFFINDDVPLALETSADGVHIGQGDMPLAQALTTARPNSNAAGRKTAWPISPSARFSPPVPKPTPPRRWAPPPSARRVPPASTARWLPSAASIPPTRQRFTAPAPTASP